jgi:phasin family protein
MAVQKAVQSNDIAKLFSSFAVPGFPFDQLVSIQRRNFEAATTAVQIAADSWHAMFRRQQEVFGQAAEEGSKRLRDLFAPGAPDEKLAQHADFVKSAVEKGLTNFREVSDILVKSSVGATEVLAKRATEGLTELSGAVESAALRPRVTPVP